MHADGRRNSALTARAAQAAVKWAAAEGWNPGLDDAERLLAADPAAFLSTDHDGEIAGTISCAVYGDDYAFLGFYIVREDLRSRGIGSALFDRALARAGRRVVGLDGVLARQASYARRGFVLAHRNVRWRTTGGGTRPRELVALSDVAVGDVLEYDAAVFGCARERFLRVWIDRPAGQALAFVREGLLVGYGVIRPCVVGAKVGPLIADDEDAAQDLLAGLLAAAAPGTDVFIDMPAANTRAPALRASRKMEASFETARMYLNGRPREDVQKVFGVTTLEFG